MNYCYRTLVSVLLTAGLLVIGIYGCTGAIGSNLNGDDDDSGQGAADGIGGWTPGGGNHQGGDSETDCGDMLFTPEPIGVSAYVMVDKSGSMTSNSKWTNTKNAFISFFSDPEADSLKVALRFWPDGVCDTNCSVAACVDPQVPMGSLTDPNHEQALINAFNGWQPGGLTPMEAALGGACEYAVQNQTGGEAGQRLVVIFLTDGIPTACNENIGVISGYAADAYNNHDVLTFAVGLQGSEEAQINAIASAGGTTQGYFIGSNNGEAELLAALKDIQQIAIACTFAMPESPDPNKAVDPAQVHIYYLKDASDPGSEIPYVGDEASCDPNVGGWYYDDPQDPAVIFLCDASCSQANDVTYPDGSLNVVAGCKIIAE